MFRVKLQVPPELVMHYIERIKTGVRGEGYVKASAAATWPHWLEKGLLNPPKAANAPAAAPASASSDASVTPK
jgi:HlyD family secretion protein